MPGRCNQYADLSHMIDLVEFRNLTHPSFLLLVVT